MAPITSKPPSLAEHELRVVPGVDVAQLLPPGVEDAEEQREVDGAGRGLVDLAIELGGEPREIGLERQPRPQRRLHVGHQQRGADALARHVADEQRQPSVRQREVIEEVAADFARRESRCP